MTTVHKPNSISSGQTSRSRKDQMLSNHSCSSPSNSLLLSKASLGDSLLRRRSFNNFISHFYIHMCSLLNMQPIPHHSHPFSLNCSLISAAIASRHCCGLLCLPSGDQYTIVFTSPTHLRIASPERLGYKMQYICYKPFLMINSFTSMCAG